MAGAFVAALVFGIILLADGDWIPGGIIVGATLLGLAVQIPVIRKLCSVGASSSPPKSKPMS
jgi:predicted NAD/FAD-dependent oxidoreductase